MAAARSSQPAAVETASAEARRVRAVRRLVGALDDATGLDRLTRLAARLLSAPSAQVTLVAEAPFVASGVGLGATTPPVWQVPEDESLCAVTVRSGEPLAVGDAAADPRVALLRPVVGDGLRAYLGVPLRDADGRTVGALCVYDVVPRDWPADQVALLGELAESVVAELEMRALSMEARSTAARLGLALDAAQIGSFDLDTDTNALHWDERLIRLFGYDADTFVEHLDSFTARLHPEDVERVGSTLAQAVAMSGELSMEYRIVLPGGDVRWIEARGRVLRARGQTVARLLGVAYDNTELREARDRLARVLETMNDAFYILDRDWRFTYVNREAERLLRRSRDDLLGKCIWDEFPEAFLSPFKERYEHAVATGEPVVFEAPYDPLGGWYELSAWPGPDGLSVYFRETTRRRRAEDEREKAYAEREQAVVERERAYAAAEAANRRLALLADASTRLAESLEPRQVLERIGELVVPGLGGWLVVGVTAETAATLLGQESPADPDRIAVVHLVHADPGRRALLAQTVDELRLSPANRVGIGAVIASGRTEWLPELSTEDVEHSFEVPALALTALQGLDLRAALTVPLASRGRVLGAMTVGDPTGGAVDRALLADLAARAGVALDNALLFGAERRTGITLQRSLLPREVPAVPGLLAAARYLPGATGAFVGGDWYQGVRVGTGLVLAMGDVMGHGMRSAARMGQLRAIVATLALEGHGPGRLLTGLARHVDVLLDLELATLLVAAYDPVDRRLTVASAGHPPPLLAPLGAAPRFIDVDAGPPLGSFAFDYTEVEVDVPAGATLVLYTDGLVENREESLDLGLERLRSALEDVRLPPERVCDHVLERMGRRGGGEDDVALLVLSHVPGEPS